MRFEKSGEGVKNIKCREDGGNIRLTFNWPEGVEQVYVFLGTTDANPAMARIFTIQEYKKRGGILLQKVPGVFTYYICPFQRENGEDICFTPEDQGGQITHTTKINIDFTIREKIGRHKNHEITLSADYPVNRGIVKYAKEPSGIRYVFGEITEPGQQVTKIARTAVGEHLRLFIDEEFSELYNLRG